MPNWQHVAYQSAVNAGHPEPHVFVAQMMAESGLKPGQTSSAGAQGIAQIMPATAKGWGVNPNDPYAALGAAAKAMTKYYKSYNGNRAMALAAYNAGTGAVAQYNGVPPYSETRNYIQKITASAGKYARAGQGPSGAAGGPQKPAQSLSAGPARPYQNPTALSNQINRIQYAYMDAPDAAKPHVDKLMAGFQGGSLSQTQPNVVGNANAKPGGKPQSAGGGFFMTPNGKVRNRLEDEKVYEFFQRLGKVGFGLRNDPGNSQTTGGRHSTNSLHYDERAVDFGNAANTEQQLDRFYSWASARRPTLGIEELIWRAPDHENHLHIGGASGPPPTVRPTNVRRRARNRPR